MSIAKGAKSLLLWKSESTYNTAPSGNWNTLPFNSETLDENINTIQSDDMRSDRANPPLRGGNIATGGGLVQDFGRLRTFTLLRHLLGAAAPTDSTVTPTAYAASTAYNRGAYVTGETSHIWVCVKGGTTAAGAVAGDLPASSVTGTIVEVAGTSTTTLKFMRAAAAATTINSLTMNGAASFQAAGLAVEKQIIGGDATGYIQFTGGRVNSLDLTVPQEGIVKATWNLLFAKSTKLTFTGGGTPVAAFSETPFSGFDAWVHFNESTSFQAATVRPHREFTMTLTNNVSEDTYIIGDRYRQDLPEGTRRASGRMSIYFQDMTEYDVFKNETEVSMAVSFVNGGHFFRISFPEAKITGSGSPKISGAGAVVCDFEWTAYKQDSSNEVTVYYAGTDLIASVPA